MTCPSVAIGCSEGSSAEVAPVLALLNNVGLENKLSTPLLNALLTLMVILKTSPGFKLTFSQVAAVAAQAPEIVACLARVAEGVKTKTPLV